MKNFENEYREMIQEEMPDLWERIEAGLVEKKPAEERSEKSAATDEEPVVRRGKLYFVRRYSGLAAACLCGVIVLPVMALLIFKGGVVSKDAACVETAACTEAAAEIPLEQTDKATASKNHENALAGYEEAMTGGTGTEAGNEMDGVAAEEMTAPEAEEMEAAAAEEMTAPTAETMNAATETEIADGSILENVTVKVLAVDVLSYHTIYSVEVITDENGVFLPGARVEFLAVNDESQPLKEGETYTVTLEYTQQGEISWHLKAPGGE